MTAHPSRTEAGSPPAAMLPDPPSWNEFEHLEPLLAEFARSDDGPRRTRLRESLITGYLPVARRMAAKYHDPLSVGIGAVLGLWSVALLVTRRGTLKSDIPFGPFMLAGAAAAMLLPAG